MRFVCAFVLGVLLPTSLFAGGIPAKTLKELKAASVYVKVQMGGGAKPVPVTGSGFLLHVEKDAGYIVTNDHVVNPMMNEMRLGNPKVVFDSGMPSEQTLDALIVAADPVRDLAILKVMGLKEFPRPIPLDQKIEASETMPVYALGFPFGQGLALGRGNPTITITKGTISALRYDEQGKVKLVQIDAEINPGNSGGPLVDEKGNLVGVSVSKIVQARTVGFAVPVAAVTEMMDGKVASVFFDTDWVVKNQAQVHVDATLVDPLGKLKDLAVHYRIVGDTDVKQLQKDTKGVLETNNPLWMKVYRGRGQGRLTLNGNGKEKVRIAYQASVVNAAGKTVLSPIGVATIDLTQVIYSDKLTKIDPPGPGGKPHKVFSHSMKAGKHFILDMRANPQDMDPRLLVRDSTGKILAEDDGAGGIFDALMTFTPPKDGDYEIVSTVIKGEGPFVLRIREDVGQSLGANGYSMAGKLADTDPLDRVKLAPAQSFNVILKSGKHYSIDMKSADFDPFLRIENMANVALKTEDIGGNGHSTLLYSPIQDGIFRIIATSFDLKTGRFDLQVRETAGPKKFDVAADGLKLTQALALTDPIDVINGKASTFRGKVFEVKMKARQKYQIDLESTQFDPFLRVEDLRGKQLAADDDSGGNLNARIVFTAPTEGYYRIIASQFDARVGSFNLTVRELP